MYETHLLYARLSRNPETGIIPLDQADNASMQAGNWSMIFGIEELTHPSCRTNATNQLTSRPRQCKEVFYKCLVRSE
jgi:hypothetical protein